MSKYEDYPALISAANTEYFGALHTNTSFTRTPDPGSNTSEVAELRDEISKMMDIQAYPPERQADRHRQRTCRVGPSADTVGPGGNVTHFKQRRTKR